VYMEVVKAAELGFCTGVRRAIQMLERAASQRGPLLTLGPVVHNQRVMEELARLGIRAVDNVEQLEEGTVAISSHGVSPGVMGQMEARGFNIVDTTCPFVRRAQIAAKRLHSAGFYVIVFGDQSHPEVQGVLGWANNEGMATIKPPPFERPPQRIGILSQTTQSLSSFAHFVDLFVNAHIAQVSELRIINTICDATRRRQEAALELARKVDLMLVVGSHISANTRRLTEICSTVVETHLIDAARNIHPGWLSNKQRVGITAGASTPDDSIEEVVAILATVK